MKVQKYVILRLFSGIEKLLIDLQKHNYVFYTLMVMAKAQGRLFKFHSCPFDKQVFLEFTSAFILSITKIGQQSACLSTIIIFVSITTPVLYLCISIHVFEQSIESQKSKSQEERHIRRALEKGSLILKILFIVRNNVRDKLGYSNTAC